MSSNYALDGHPGENNQANQQKEDAEMQQEPVNMIAKLLTGMDA